MDEDSVDIVVIPKIYYDFQAVAREDKGVIGGVDWNKSPTVTFKTSSIGGNSGPPPKKGSSGGSSSNMVSSDGKVANGSNEQNSAVVETNLQGGIFAICSI